MTNVLATAGNAEQGRAMKERVVSGRRHVGIERANAG